MCYTYQEASFIIILHYVADVRCIHTGSKEHCHIVMAHVFHLKDGQGKEVFSKTYKVLWPSIKEIMQEGKGWGGLHDQQR